jgi:hypothetical protein
VAGYRQRISRGTPSATPTIMARPTIAGPRVPLCGATATAAAAAAAAAADAAEAPAPCVRDRSLPRRASSRVAPAQTP